MKLLNVVYERPITRDRIAGAEWSFLAKFDTAHVLDGVAFGGEVKRIDTTSGKAWVANQDQLVGAPGLTREAAITHLQPLVYASYEEHKRALESQHAEYERRGELRKQLLSQLPAGFMLAVSEVSKPLTFTVRVENLTEEDIRSLAAKLTEAKS